MLCDIFMGGIFSFYFWRAGIAKTGANVLIVSRNASDGQQTVKEIQEKSVNKNISFLTADLSLRKSVVYSDPS